jgi:hypothetical protein
MMDTAMHSAALGRHAATATPLAVVFMFPRSGENRAVRKLVQQLGEFSPCGAASDGSQHTTWPGGLLKMDSFRWSRACSWSACIKESSQQLKGEAGQSGPRINDRQCSSREAKESMESAVLRRNQAGSMIPGAASTAHSSVLRINRGSLSGARRKVAWEYRD